MKLQRWIDGSNFPSDQNIEKHAQKAAKLSNKDEKEITDFYADLVASIVNYILYFAVFYSIYIYFNEDEKYKKEKIEKENTIKRFKYITGSL